MQFFSTESETVVVQEVHNSSFSFLTKLQRITDQNLLVELSGSHWVNDWDCFQPVVDELKTK